MRITLTVVEGPSRGLAFRFEEHSTFFVGRSPDAHFRLPEHDPYFSRMHFLVEINPPLCRLVDMNSRNGTHVNGQRVPTCDLQDGDQIRAGHTVLRVALEAPTQDSPATLSCPAVPGSAPSVLAVPASPTHLSPAGRAEATHPGNTIRAEPPAVPGYEVLDELGRGAMGIVYRARRLKDGVELALKTILPAVQPTDVTVNRFLREANILRELDHPHIVRFSEMGYSEGRLFFVMDYVPGTDAARLLGREGPLAVDRAVSLVCQLLEALAYAHARGFVHRDVKPANLLVTAEGSREVVKLTDFGLARAYQSSPLSGLTLTGATAGTPAFMPPEQVLDFRSARPPADQYSAAVTLYTLLTGHGLYDAANTPLQLMLHIVTDDPTPIGERRADLPAELAAAIHRALARRPEDRHPDVTAFRGALLPFCKGMGTAPSVEHCA